MDRRGWWATVHGVTESDTTEWLTFGLTHIRVPSTNKENTNWAPVLAPASAANKEALESRFSQENVPLGLCPLCELTGTGSRIAHSLIRGNRIPLQSQGALLKEFLPSPEIFKDFYSLQTDGPDLGPGSTT